MQQAQRPLEAGFLRPRGGENSSGLQRRSIPTSSGTLLSSNALTYTQIDLHHNKELDHKSKTFTEN